MSCYICLAEQVRTPFTGICAQCNQGACGRPPQRRDHQFHGELCAHHACARFFCENHLHTHTHQGSSVSVQFAPLAMAIAIDTIGCTSALRDGDPVSLLRADREAGRNGHRLLERLNRYLTVVSPGASSMRFLGDRISSEMFEYREIPTIAEQTLVLNDAFFTESAVDALAQMAVRSIWLASSAIRPKPTTMRLKGRLEPWLEGLGIRNVVPSIDMDDLLVERLSSTLNTLVPPTRALDFDWHELPDEGDPQGVGLYFLHRREHGEEAVLAEL